MHTITQSTLSKTFALLLLIGAHKMIDYFSGFYTDFFAEGGTLWCFAIEGMQW